VVTIECPWCAESAHVEGSAHAEVVCTACGIVVEIAPDPVREPLDRAA
jgi:transcription initiation factor TFIIIB Brf1 subunit/transcription initiation factor TFIIB